MHSPTLWAYIGGVFDGDGCVTAVSKHSVRLSVTQASRGRALLHLLHACLGGTIYERNGGKPVSERHQPVAVWVLGGAAAKAVCLQLQAHTYLKRAQFSLASSGRTLEMLPLLKQEAHAPIEDLPLPLPYCAGLLDTDGGLRVVPCIRFSVSQKYPAVLHALQKTFDKGTVCKESDTAYRWQVYGKNAKHVLSLIQDYTHVKKEQVSLVLQARLTKDTDTHIALMAYQGNQGCTTENKLLIMPTTLRPHPREDRNVKIWDKAHPKDDVTHVLSGSPSAMGTSTYAK